ncbi:MAG: flagellar motor protein MotB [Bdellovibrionales bacterium]|nr:flagellar motor protein MotB [Bdellovibrionales bacterium]
MNFKIFSFILVFFTITACVSKSKYEELETQYGSLQAEHDAAKNQVTDLEALVAELERKLGKASTDQKSLSQSIDYMKQALADASARKKEVEKRMAEYRKLVNQFKALTDAGELSIKIVDGRMVVAMPSDVLFASGSAKLSSKGQQTIEKVAKLLVTIPDKKFQIEGHTDNVPIRSSRFPSNWELASARSVNVLKTMVQAGMPENRISAASFGETRPVAANDSKEGKQANRRIEVVLMPDLSQLPGYEELQRLSEEK